MKCSLITLFLLLLISSPLYAQENEADGFNEITIEKRLLPYTNPLNQDQLQPATVVPREPLDDLGRDVLRRISDLYKIHVSVLDALAEDDLIEAEEEINKALTALQSLVDDYPEVQYQSRFTELYRTVLAEHRDFYGITEPLVQEEGDIFAIQEELFSRSDDWMAEGFVLPDNLALPTTQVPLIQNRFVTRQISYYTYTRADVMERWLQRSEQYFPMMKRIFQEEGTPEELIYMSMIESGLVPTARSSAGAVGMWQFMPATGRASGLEINFWIDERRDPVKATRAAARHLKELYEYRNDWHLAIANYNISPRGLNRALSRADGDDYWAALPYLPRETQGYVPGYIAAATVAMNAETFGFERSYGGEEWSYDIVEVDGLMSLDRLAEAAGLTTQELKDYNPELLRWATPPGNSYPLKLPSGSRDEFLIAYENIPQEERHEDVAMHTVTRGETVSQIAYRYGSSVRALYEANENLSTTIYPGQTIVVPVAGGSAERIAADQPSNSSIVASVSNSYQAPAPANTNAVSYTVKSGDTVGHIAEWYDVYASQIRSWNGIGNTIRPGQRLTVYVSAERTEFYSQINQLSNQQKQELLSLKRQGVDIYSRRYTASAGSGNSSRTYTVRSNDTLSTIARSFGVSIAAIQQLNNLSGTIIYVGQTLRIQ